jgi:hypothetical protein
MHLRREPRLRLGIRWHSRPVAPRRRKGRRADLIGCERHASEHGRQRLHSSLPSRKTKELKPRAVHGVFGRARSWNGRKWNKVQRVNWWVDIPRCQPSRFSTGTLRSVPRHCIPLARLVVASLPSYFRRVGCPMRSILLGGHLVGRRQVVQD